VSKDKFTFYKDQFGVYVFYTGINRDVRHQGGLKINDTVDFDSSVACVVPPVKRVSSSETEDQITGYKSSVNGKTKTTPAYRAELHNLEGAAQSVYVDAEDEVKARVKLRRFEEEWDEETQQVEVHTDYEFEIVDIEYPADERLRPLRHLDNEKVNYFQVNGSQVAINFAHLLCKDVDLKHDDEGKKRGTYHIPSYGTLQYWNIEGNRYGQPTETLRLHDFTGDLAECRKYINEIESCVRGCFDDWEVSGKQPSGLTVGVVTKHLDRILQQVHRIETKIKTKHAYETVLHLIEKAKLDIVDLAVEELEKENSNDSLDNEIF